MSTVPMEASADAGKGISRYASLGLLANPFAGATDQYEPAVQCDIQAAGNRLLKAILAAREEAQADPIWVDKDAEVPPSYPLAAVAHAERTLAVDDEFNVLYAYVQLFMFKIGVTRGTLGVLAERLAFRDFERTLVPYVRKVLDSPDDSLAAYAVVGSEALGAFAAEFEADPLTAVRRVFGEPELERHKELIEVVDVRKGNLEEDGDEDEMSAEVDETLGDAPGASMLLPQPSEESDGFQDLLDYFIEYTRVHLSPVLARGLRMYRIRGMAALSEELKITKAPRKTLSNLVDFASLRFGKAALIYDEFRSWMEIPEDLRSDVAASMVKLRWKLAARAVMVFIFSDGEVPEIEEQLPKGPRVPWSFANIGVLQENPSEFVEAIVNEWIESATLPGRDPLTVDLLALNSLVTAAEGELPRFIAMAYAAIEDAAERGVARVDAEAIAAATS